MCLVAASCHWPDVRVHTPSLPPGMEGFFNCVCVQVGLLLQRTLQAIPRGVTGQYMCDANGATPPPVSWASTLLRRACAEMATGSILDRPRLVSEGAKPSDGVPDMTIISDIDEHGINTNLKVRYRLDRIYVSAPDANRCKPCLLT